MRLGDLDALKKATKSFTDCDGFNPVWQIIDNAPTVEFPEQVTIKCDTEEDRQKLISAFRNAKLKLLVEEERPTGEWIEFADYVARNVVSDDFSEDVDFYAEVLCRKLVKLGLVKLDGDTYEYCGSKMGRGEEE